MSALVASYRKLKFAASPADWRHVLQSQILACILRACGAANWFCGISVADSCAIAKHAARNGSGFWHEKRLK